MREYKKPTIQVVNLKSAEDIAVSYKAVAGDIIDQYLKGSKYSVTQYNLELSTPVATLDV